MIRKLIVATGVTLSLAACASAGKRYDQGQELQRAGRPAEAAERYIQALKKDSRLDSARVGLRTAGDAAIAAYLRTAADPATTPDGAAEAYVAINDLSKRALAVGIYLVPPTGYETGQRIAFDKAIASDVADARLLAQRRQFADALNRLGRASAAYQPSGAQTTAIGNAGADVALAWGRADTTDGNFRSAFSRVDQIANLPGATRAQADDARALQTIALSRGTRRVVIVPVSATLGARRDLPEDVLLSLGDALMADPWTAPPRFVELIPPVDVDRELRRSGLGRRTLSILDASRVGRALGADYVVVSEMDSVRREDMNVRVTRHPVRMRNGADTAYVTEEGTARLFGRTSFVLVDRDGQRLSEYQEVTASATSPFTRVRFNGDIRNLDLRQSERDLFARGSNDRDLTNAFVATMSPRLGEAVFAELLRRIP